jgi:ribosomal protein S18 acetylase RimI-like enzyme
MDVFRWRNDPLVCAMSRQDEAISEVAHMNWYSQAVEDPDRLLLIGVLDGKSIGIVRFDHLGEAMREVSITTAPEARGQGLARHFLEMALTYLYEVYSPASVLAVVRLNNEPSLKLFHALGFNRESDDGVFTSFVLPPNTGKLSP